MVKFAPMTTITSNSLDQVEVIGDRVLIKPKEETEKTSAGLYLPPSVKKEEDKIFSGYVIKTGPGYPVPMGMEEEPWKDEDKQVKYIPLQVKEGDLAVYLNKSAWDVRIDDINFVLVSYSSVLMVFRDQGMFE